MKILAIDGNSVINRAYFGVRPLTNGRGERTEAVYGTMNMVLAAVDTVKPDSVAAAFDLSSPTFRHKLYDGYKGNRKGMEEELYAQLQPTKDLLSALGCDILSREGYEADDILGTIASKAEEESNECFILTGDRDSLQLISDSTRVILAGKETKIYDRAAFVEKYGISPEQFVDAKALMGDSSDCIPGVAGIGEKTALPLIARFGSLDGVYAHLDDETIKSGVRIKLENGKESAYLSQKLAQIEKKVPIDLPFSPFEAKKELYETLLHLEFSSFITRLGLTAQSGAVKSETIYENARLEELSLQKTPVYAALDGGDLLLSTDQGNYRITELDPFSLAEFFAPGREVCVCGAKELYAWLDSYGIDDFTLSGDVALEGYVLCSTDGDYDLAALALRYLSVKLDAPDARAISELDALLTKKLKDEGTFELYKNVELPLSRVLYDCEKTGVLIDRAGIAAFGEELLGAIEKSEKSIYALAGKRFNISSPKQLGQVLFEDLGLIVPGLKKTKNGYSTNAETLDKLKYEPIVSQVLEYRQLTKLHSTYTEGLLKVADAYDRVHTKFTQTVTATGRLSSIEPNLQNIPVRTDLGRALRRYFTAPEGSVLIDADYSQIELRILAHAAKDQRMIDAFNNGVDIHSVTAAEVFGMPLEEVTNDLRKRAKAVNFGIVYGISAFSLSDDLHISRREAEEYIAGYFATYPAIRAYLDQSVEEGKKEGFVKTLFGRKRYIPELTSGKGMLKKFGERVAMNSPIQGSAADVIKIAMVNVYRALQKELPNAHLILQVHDELIVECPEGDAQKAAEILRREMECAADFEVRLEVDLHIGKTWYDCK